MSFPEKATKFKDGEFVAPEHSDNALKAQRKKLSSSIGKTKINPTSFIQMKDRNKINLLKTLGSIESDFDTDEFSDLISSIIDKLSENQLNYVYEEFGIGNDKKLLIDKVREIIENKLDYLILKDRVPDTPLFRHIILGILSS